MPWPITAGLGVLDRRFMPHVGSPEHPETAERMILAAQLEAQGVPIPQPPDGDVLVRDGDRVEVVT